MEKFVEVIDTLILMIQGVLLIAKIPHFIYNYYALNMSGHFSQVQYDE